MARIFSLEGNIGSGKSTLIRILQKKYTNIIFVLEPIDEWALIKDDNEENILTKFYNNQEKYAFSFQMMAYISRLAQLKKIIKEHPWSIIITERSIFTDRNVFAKMLYDNKKIETINYQIYLSWFDCFIKDIQLEGIIYLDVSPEKCYKRVLKRKRSGETITLPYLKCCHEYHTQWLKNKKNILCLKDDGEFESDNSKIIEWFQKIDNFIHINNNKIPNNSILHSFNHCHHC